MELLLVLVVVVVAVAVHELAHVAAARAVGHTVFEIQIGAGPQWSFRVRDIDVGLAMIPIGGYVQTGARSTDGFRWRSAVVAGSGMTANGALAGIGVVAGIRPLVVFNVLAVAANLWPGARRRLGAASSDGRVLLDLARNDQDALAEERSGWFCIEAMRARDRGELDEARRLVDEGMATAGETRALQAIAAVLAFEQRRFADAVAAYAPLIDDSRVTVAARAGFAADAAWSASLSDDAELVSLAQPWAAFAHAERPRLARRRLILALAQVDAGEAAAALATLGDLSDASADAVRVLALVAAGDTSRAAVVHAERVAPRLAADHPLHERVMAVLGEG